MFFDFTVIIAISLWIQYIVREFTMISLWWSLIHFLTLYLLRIHYGSNFSFRNSIWIQCFWRDHYELTMIIASSLWIHCICWSSTMTIFFVNSILIYFTYKFTISIAYSFRIFYFNREFTMNPQFSVNSLCHTRFGGY